MQYGRRVAGGSRRRTTRPPCACALRGGRRTLRDELEPLRDGSTARSSRRCRPSRRRRRCAARARRSARRTSPTCSRCSPTRRCRSTAGVPPEALALATTLVRRGVDPGDLVHAYLVGQNELWRAWMEELTHAARHRTGAGRGARAVLGAALQPRRLPRRAADAPRRPRARALDGRRARAPRQLVRALLTEGESDVAEASRALGYDLDRWVLAAVLWERPATTRAAARRLEARRRAARAAARAGAHVRAGRRRACGRGSRTPEQPDLGRVAAALDGRAPRRARASRSARPAQGLEGFRLGHQEALRRAPRGRARRRDGRRPLRRGRGDLAAERRPRAAGALRPAHARPARRATTRRPSGCARPCWPGWPRAATRAAPPSALHAHKNTVLYRLQRAQQILGRPLDDDRGELELALTAMAAARARADRRT